MKKVEIGQCSMCGRKFWIKLMKVFKFTYFRSGDEEVEGWVCKGCQLKLELDGCPSSDDKDC